MHMHTMNTFLTTLLVPFLSAAAHCQEKQLDGPSLPRVKLETPEEHGGLNLFTFSPDGSILAGATGVGTVTSSGKTTTFGGDVLLWNPSSGSITQTFGRHDSTPSVLSFTNDGKHILSYSSEDHVAKLWRVSDGSLTTELKLGGPGSSKQKPVMSPDGRFLVHLVQRHLDLGSSNGLDASFLLETWDIQTKKLLWKKTVDDPNGQLDARIGISPDSKTVAVSVKEVIWKENGPSVTGQTAEKYHALLNLETGENIWRVDIETRDRSRPHPEAQILFTPDGAEILMVGRNDIRRYSTANGEKIGDPINLKDDKSVSQVYFDPNGKQFLVTRFFDRQVDVHAFPSGETLFLVNFGFPASLNDASPDQDLRKIAGQLKFDPVVIDLASGFKK